MNGIMRKKLYRIIAERDGEYCNCCGKLPSEGQLVIDHKDNNEKNNDLANLQLLCRSCNYLKNPRRPVDECESECVSEADIREINVSRNKEPQFRKFVFHEVNEKERVSESDIINSGAEEITISPVTAKRYLNKMCSSRGLLERVRQGEHTLIQYKSEPNLL